MDQTQETPGKVAQIKLGTVPEELLRDKGLMST
jgi:hypothetical protein